MFNTITRFFESPNDKDPSFIALARNILIFTIVATVLSLIVVAAAANSSFLVVILVTLTITTVLELIAFRFVLRGNLILAKVVVPAALVFTVTIITFNGNTLHDISIIGYAPIIVIATLLQGRRSLYVTTPLTAAAILFLGIADMLGISHSPVAQLTGIDDILIVTLLLFSTAGILNLLIGRLNLIISQTEAASLEVKKLKDSLEQQVEERTAELKNRGEELLTANEKAQRRASQLDALTQVTRSITSIRELKELLPLVTATISEKFGYYHVGIFMNDLNDIYAVLSAANSEGGKRMLARGHQLKIGEQGIVGNVAFTGKPRIALDVGAEPVYFNNPDLPDTSSEMALPLKIGGTVVGALDVQSTEKNAFTSEDVDVLTTLADQVSLAIQNARLFEQTQKSLNEAEAVHRQYLRETWAHLPQEQKLLGFRYSAGGAMPLSETASNLKSATQLQNSDDQKRRVSVPVTLRGEKIGELSVQVPKHMPIKSDQMDLIKAVAERVALSIENARLFEETRKRAERERLVTDITTKIRSTNDPQDMIRTAMEELQKALGATRVEIIPNKSSMDADK